MKRLFLILSIAGGSILLSCKDYPQAANGGYRIDQASFSVNIPEKAYDICIEINSLKLRLSKAPSETWNPFKNSKPEIGKEIFERQNNLKTYLASTPKGQNVSFSSVTDISRSNKEIAEVSNATKNLDEMILASRQKLLADKSNIEVAKEYYAIQYESLSAIVEMGEEFIKNIDINYSITVTNSTKKLQLLRDQTRKKLRMSRDSTDISTLKGLTKAQDDAIRGLQLASKTLMQQKTWAQHRTKVLKEKLDIVELARDTAIAISDVINFIEGVQNILAKLGETPLPLIVFETDLSKLEPKELGQ